MDILQTKLGFRNPALEQGYRDELQGRYCSNCGSCETASSSGVEIKSTVRYHMYYKDYGLKDYARACFARLEPRTDQASLLKDCDLCEKVCPRRLPLRKIVSEAQALLA